MEKEKPKEKTNGNGYRIGNGHRIRDPFEKLKRIERGEPLQLTKRDKLRLINAMLRAEASEKESDKKETV